MRNKSKITPEYEIARQIIDARLKQKMSQEDLARKAKTGQAVISRLERMNANPSLPLLKRIAQSLNTKITFTVP
ncbi:helix-turn-helix transcriptional regulator [Candidatus Gottesmanbacteria bacterium]|nr:helix-turn-helix transcriptional regulator [Candidatus Gottesmanbacteria bacterium]